MAGWKIVACQPERNYKKVMRKPRCTTVTTRAKGVTITKLNYEKLRCLFCNRYQSYSLFLTGTMMLTKASDDKFSRILPY